MTAEIIRAATLNAQEIIRGRVLEADRIAGEEEEERRAERARKRVGPSSRAERRERAKARQKEAGKELAKKREAGKRFQEWSTPEEKADERVGERLCERRLMYVGLLVFAKNYIDSGKQGWLSTRTNDELTMTTTLTATKTRRQRQTVGS